MSPLTANRLCPLTEVEYGREYNYEQRRGKKT